MSDKALVLGAVGRLRDDATFGAIADAIFAIVPPGSSSHDGSRPTRVDEEPIEFIAAGPGPERVAEFRPSDEARRRVSDLIAREKSSGLGPDEAAELDHYLRLEHLMRLANRITSASSTWRSPRRRSSARSRVGSSDSTTRTGSSNAGLLPTWVDIRPRPRGFG